MARGFFITFEGPDGSGKSTQIRAIADRLQQLGIGYITTREPGGTFISDQIRTLLLNPANQGMTPETEALLYAASRAQHVAEVIRPALDQGLVVLCDRYIDASIAYQACGLGLSPHMIRRWSEEATGGLWPDRTILVDLPAQVGIDRIAQNRQGLDRIEARSVDYHSMVRNMFLELAAAEPERFLTVSGQHPPEQVTDAIWADLHQRIQQQFK